MTHKSLRNAPLVALLALAIAGCGGTSGGDGNTDAIAELLFSPTGGAVPSPNDLAFDGSQDGSVNASQPPLAATSGPLDSIESINSQDGFSTIASSTASFSVPVDPTTVVPGSTVRVFEVTVDPATKAVTGLVGELTPGAPGDPGAQYTASLSSADRNGRTLAVTPLVPLNDSPSNPLADDTAYLVAVTNGVEEEGGGPISASEEYELVKGTDPLFDGTNSLVAGFDDTDAETLEGVRQLTQAQLAITTGAGIATADLIGTWSFSTQSIGPVLAAADGLIGSASITANTFAPTGSTTDPDGAADIWVGSLSGVPYYLAEPTGADPTAPLTKFWEAANPFPGTTLTNLTAANDTPLERSTIDIPVVVGLPNGTLGPPCPCDVVIFQHGITTNRKSALGIANTLAKAGFATIGIDLPLHGITDTSDPLYAGSGAPFEGLYAGNIERTFDLDLIDNATDEAGPDGQIDPSGAHFVNFASLRTTRDNLRQAVVDLLALESALGDIDAAVGDALDPSTVHFVGQSLGAIVGIPYLSQSGSITNAVLAAPGGGVAKVFDGSPRFGPTVAAGLAENGLVKGLSGYEQFLGVAQTLVDSADPLNHATDAVGGVPNPAPGSNDDGGGAPAVLVFEIVGGNSSDPDQVVPNVVSPSYPGTSSDTIGSPTGGTEPLIAAMGLEQVGSTNSGTVPANADTVVKLTAGEHSSLINPATDPAVIAEMQAIAATFIGSGSTVITDNSVVEDP